MTRATLGGLVLLVALTMAIRPESSGGPDSSAGLEAATGGVPERPRRSVDTRTPAVTGRTLHVPAGGDLQAALDQSKAGDEILLEPGATYTGPFRLPRKEGTGWVVVASTRSQRFPGEQERVDPSHAPQMAKLIASSGFVVSAAPGAHHYRLIGLEIAPAEGVFLRALVQLGDDERNPDDQPRSIVIDRCYLHGDRQRGTRRGVAMNSRDTAVVNSYLSDFKEVGADSQAIAAWNGEGPFKIANNYLEAAGENVMFGGADPAIRDLVPADIEIVGNHIAKPLRWRQGERAFEGVEWSVKNLFELKNARRVVVDGNLFENNWPAAQNGFAILFTVRNQDGEAAWSVVEDVTFSNNVVRHVAGAINVLGHDDIHRSGPTRRLAIRNNLFVDIGGAWGKGRLFQLLNGTSDLTIDHNTAANGENIIWGGDGEPHARFIFQNNLVLHNHYGVIGAATEPGRLTIDRYFPGARFRRNVIVGGTPDKYPADNFFPTSLEEAGLRDLPGGQYRLIPQSPYRRAGTDGSDIGVNLDTIPKSHQLSAISSQLQSKN
jgi:hypothetical protein